MRFLVAVLALVCMAATVLASKEAPSPAELAIGSSAFHSNKGAVPTELPALDAKSLESKAAQEVKKAFMPILPLPEAPEALPVPPASKLLVKPLAVGLEYRRAVKNAKDLDAKATAAENNAAQLSSSSVGAARQLAATAKKQAEKLRAEATEAARYAQERKPDAATIEAIKAQRAARFAQLESRTPDDVLRDENVQPLPADLQNVAEPRFALLNEFAAGEERAPEQVINEMNIQPLPTDFAPKATEARFAQARVESRSPSEVLASGVAPLMNAELEREELLSNVNEAVSKADESQFETLQQALAMIRSRLEEVAPALTEAESTVLLANEVAQKPVKRVRRRAHKALSDVKSLLSAKLELANGDEVPKKFKEIIAAKTATAKAEKPFEVDAPNSTERSSLNLDKLADSLAAEAVADSLIRQAQERAARTTIQIVKVLPPRVVTHHIPVIRRKVFVKSPSITHKVEYYKKPAKVVKKAAPAKKQEFVSPEIRVPSVKAAAPPAPKKPEFVNPEIRTPAVKPATPKPAEPKKEYVSPEITALAELDAELEEDME